MFPPQTTTLLDWSSPSTKGKAVAFGGEVVEKENYTEDWQRFREAGLLDVTTLQHRDHEALMEKVSKLENELYDYQYNMGLLLIEKKKWNFEYEELTQALLEKDELLRREKTANLNAVSELEKREENLKMALGVEKQSLIDLEKTLQEIRTESAETKYTAESKLAEAYAQIANFEEKSSMVEAKLHAADAKLAEANRKSSDVERKLKEIEARESSMQSERQSFNAEQAMRESNLSKQREELQDWDRTLREREERLTEGRRVINQREEKAIERDLILEKKEKGLEEAEKKFGSTNAILRTKEEDINMRLANISAKEEEIEEMKKNIDLKEKELVALEEKLNVREKVEIQKLVDDHNAVLESKENAFELAMDHKRKSFDAEFKSRFVAVEQKENEIKHMEEKISEREQELEKKMEKLNEKDKILDAKSESLREREKSIMIEEKNVDTEKKQMAIDKENLQILITDLEKKRADLEVEQLRLREEAEKPKVTEEERIEYLRLQSDLKQEIESWNHRKEVLLKEEEKLKQDRETFEKEWEVLDKKRAQVTDDLKRVSAEKESLDKMKHMEEEKMKKEKLAIQEHIQREKESLRLEKESFEAMMDHERSVAVEKARSEHEDMLCKFQLQERELKADIQNKWEEMERGLRERERAFEELKDRDLNNIKNLKQEAQREMEDLKLERLNIEKERQKISADKQHLEGQQLDMAKDIDKLDNLTKNLRDQRTQFKVLVEKYKSCKNCGEVTSDFILSDLCSLEEMEDSEALPSPRQSECYLESMQDNLTGPVVAASGGHISRTINKCASKIRKQPPHTKSKDEGLSNELKEENQQSGSAESLEQVNEDSRDESSLANKRTGKKRTRSNSRATKISASEQVIENDTLSESVTEGGRRKRRQTAAAGLQTPGGKRYTFRNRKTEGAPRATQVSPVATQVSTDLPKEKDKEDDDKIAVEEAHDTSDRAYATLINHTASSEEDNGASEERTGVNFDED